MKLFRNLLASALVAGSSSLALAADDNRVYVAHLLGGNELPVLGDPDAYGVATIVLTSPVQICYSIVLQNAAAPAAAHIHNGAGGVAGGIALALAVPAAPLPTRTANCIAAPAALITGIRSDPSSFYVNVHNAAFAGGAARGQLH
jgi:hypothetical protein